jgi:trans-aconitate methyltransferase
MFTYNINIMNNTEVEYWSHFYNKNKVIKKESDFANFITNYLKDNTLKFIDLGCGNGRDTYFLSKNYVNAVTGVDSSVKCENTNNTLFVQGDMTEQDLSNYDVVYMRFSWHSIKNEQQVKILNSIKKDTYLCIETRSILGKFDDNHYRNFTDINKLKNDLNNKFEILYLKESKGFAIFNNDDPICIRLICRRI